MGEALAEDGTGNALLGFLAAADTSPGHPVGS